MPGFFIMMSMSRCNPSQVQGNSDENWWRNTPFSTIAFIFNSRKKVLQYGWFFCHSDRYNKNILMTETATGYPSVIPCWVLLDVVFFLSYFQSLALGSERSKIWNPILIALLKTKIMNYCIPIAIEYHLIFSCLKQVTYRLICFSSRYMLAIVDRKVPFPMVKCNFFNSQFCQKKLQLIECNVLLLVLLNQIFPSKYNIDWAP